jgi:16S rRNA (guanine1516-N2)-methyltransferase
MTQCEQIQINNTEQGNEALVILIEMLKTHSIEVELVSNEDCHLHFKSERLFMKNESGEFSLDWSGDYRRHRSKGYSINSEPLAKSLLIKGNTENKIVDCTLGTGKDAILLLSFGATLDAFERNKLVFALALDAHRRCLVDDELGDFFKKHLKLHFGEAINSNCLADTAYFDPMYPEKKKKALPRKEMQIFKELVGADNDILDQLKTLREKFKNVVVKRPVKSEILDRPNASFSGKTTRYDRYS